MAPATLYMPILKAKKGEFAALKRLSAGDRAALLPIMDIPRVDMNWDLQKPKHSLDIHFDRRSLEFGRSWRADPIIVDISEIPLDERTTAGRHPIDYLFDRLRSRQVAATPTTALDRDGEFVEAVKKVVELDRRGVCIRLAPVDMELHHQLKQKLDGLLEFLAVKKCDCHVVLDLRSILSSNVSEESIVGAAAALESFDQWKTVSLAASGMPKYLSEILRAGESGLLSRLELGIWQRARQSFPNLIYGDYGTVHPDSIYEDPRVMAKTMGPNLRYAIEGEWILIRGYPFKTHIEGRKQYYSMARDLVGRPQFKGQGYSFGDEFVYERAQGRGGPGNPCNWVTMSTNHHLALVRRQIAQIGA